MDTTTSQQQSGTLVTPNEQAAPSWSLIDTGPVTRRAPRARQAIVDGTVAVAVGAAVLTGFGVELVKSVLNGESAAVKWGLAALAGLIVLGVGWWQRLRAQRPERVGLVVSTRDPRRGSAKADQLDDAARRYLTRDGRRAVRVRADLRGDPTDASTVDLVAAQVHSAVVAARSLTQDLAGIDLVPVLPLHAAFRLGARLGDALPTPIMLHSRNANAEPAFFPALRLDEHVSTTTPLVVHPWETLPGGDPTQVALALDIQRLPTFMAEVRSACRNLGIGQLLRLSTAPSGRLASTTDAFTAAAAQVYRAWRDTELSDGARTGRHAIFLSGPAVISVALGARLATANSAAWTAYTRDDTTGSYEPMPAGPISRP